MADFARIVVVNPAVGVADAVPPRVVRLIVATPSAVRASSGTGLGFHGILHLRIGSAHAGRAGRRLRPSVEHKRLRRDREGDVVRLPRRAGGARFSARAHVARAVKPHSQGRPGGCDAYTIVPRRLGVERRPAVVCGLLRPRSPAAVCHGYRRVEAAAGVLRDALLTPGWSVSRDDAASRRAAGKRVRGCWWGVASGWSGGTARGMASAVTASSATPRTVSAIWYQRPTARDGRMVWLLWASTTPFFLSADHRWFRRLLWSPSPGCCPGLPQVDPAGRNAACGQATCWRYAPWGVFPRRRDLPLGPPRVRRLGRGCLAALPAGAVCASSTVVEDGPSDDPVSGWPWAVFGLAASGYSWSDGVHFDGVDGGRGLFYCRFCRNVVSAARYACRRIAVAGPGCHA